MDTTLIDWGQRRGRFAALAVAARWWSVPPFSSRPQILPLTIIGRFAPRPAIAGQADAENKVISVSNGLHVFNKDQLAIIGKVAKRSEQTYEKVDELF